MSKEFHYLTKTAIELHNDPNFIQKRIEEQRIYINILHLKWRVGEVDTASYIDLYVSASFVESELLDRLDALRELSGSAGASLRRVDEMKSGLLIIARIQVEKKFASLLRPAPVS